MNTAMNALRVPTFHAVGAAFAAWLASAVPAPAALIVDLQASTSWVGGTTNSGRTASDTTGDYDGGGTSNDRRNVIPFDTSTPMFTTNEFNVQSSIFYGGKNNTFFNSGASIGTDNRLVNGGGLGGVDRYLLGSANNPGYGVTQFNALVALWKKENFLNGGDAAQVNIASNNAFRAQISAQIPLTGRWLVQIGGTYYVSEESFVTDTDLVGNVFNSTGVSTSQWASIDLAASGGDLTALPGSFGALSLNNIQSVGVYASFFGAPSSGTINPRWSLEAFSVDAVVIPEPSALALAAIGLGAMLLVRRRGL